MGVPPVVLVVLDLFVSREVFRVVGIVWGVVLAVACLRLLRYREPVPVVVPERDEGLDVTVVFNPSKTEDPAGRKEEVLAALMRHEPRHVRWLETTVDDPGTIVCRGALDEGTDLVLACGGDGTVMACATALVGSDVPLAILPSGTGNLVATHLALPSPLEEAVDVAFAGARHRVDVGWCQERAFLVMAGIGFDAQMVGEASPVLKRHVGWLAYVVSGARHIFDRGSSFTITVDGVTSHHWGRGVLVANIGTLTGGLVLLPDAAVDDGILDVAVLAPSSLYGWARLGFSVLSRSGRQARELEVRRGRRVEIRSSRPLPYDLDGDAFPPTRELSIVVRPSALTLMRPSPDPEL